METFYYYLFGSTPAYIMLVILIIIIDKRYDTYLNYQLGAASKEDLRKADNRKRAAVILFWITAVIDIITLIVLNLTK